MFVSAKHSSLSTRSIYKTTQYVYNRGFLESWKLVEGERKTPAKVTNQSWYSPNYSRTSYAHRKDNCVLS